MFPFGEPVTFEALVNGGDNSHGDASASYASPVVVQGCAFDPGASIEQYGPGRDAVITTPRVFMPPGSGVTVSARDRVTVRGLLFQVLGDPDDWRDPFTGWAPGVVVALQRVTG